MSMREYKDQVRNIRKSSLALILASNKIQRILSHFNLPPISYQEKVLRAKKNLNIIYLTSTQRGIIEEISKEMSSLLPFHDFVIRGFLWRSIRQWQRKHNQPIILVAGMDRVRQFRVGIEILNFTRQYLNRAMYVPNKKLKKRFLNDVFRKISEYYEELLAVRAFINDPDNEEILLDYEIETWLENNAALFPLKK
ncbi:MAG: hypothetical protein JSW11_02540 [Candidatus Heimdallarchaeota archaeon]|nr:MAG: hypothetical protein JSW11_02540 [Candidatus Heimdallarchaeota archaeon]